MLTRSGEYRYVRGLGFITREEIRRTAGRKNSQLVWEEAPPESTFKNVWSGRGAYAVVQGQ